MGEAELLIERRGSVGRIILNRPGQLNALNLGMLQAFTRALHDFGEDERILQVELSGAGARGLCAGADVRQVRDAALVGNRDAVVEFFTTEYQLNLAIRSFPRPYRALMSGITMGGGLGISAHGSQRIVDASSQLAMPETRIGLFPDVFLTWLLARMPNQIGTHLALTGATIGAADAVRLGLADQIDSSAPPGDSGWDAAWLGECYAGDDPVEILGRLSESADPAARNAASEIGERSPIAVWVSLLALRQAAQVEDPAQLYHRELALAVRMALAPDFAEGVRAQLVDRDQQPRWQHADLAQVTRAEALAYFEPLA